MNAGWTEVVVVLLCLSGCERIVAEPPPPPSKHDVPAAPPGALGARAAGSDAAPKPQGYEHPEPPDLGSEPGTDEDEPGPDGGTPRPGKDVPL